MWHVCLDDGKLTWTKNTFNPYELKEDSYFGYWFNYESCFICAYDCFIDENPDRSNNSKRNQTEQREKSEDDILKSLSGFARLLIKKEVKKPLKQSEPEKLSKLKYESSNDNSITDKIESDENLKKSKPEKSKPKPKNSGQGSLF